MDIPRISPEQAREDVTYGNALLICAYDSEQRCRDNYVPGALLSMRQLRELEDELPRDREIIFYCA